MSAKEPKGWTTKTRWFEPFREETNARDTALRGARNGRLKAALAECDRLKAEADRMVGLMIGHRARPTALVKPRNTRTPKASAGKMRKTPKPT